MELHSKLYSETSLVSSSNIENNPYSFFFYKFETTHPLILAFTYLTPNTANTKVNSSKETW